MDGDEPREVRILALGSPHGDDRVGWVTAERLSQDPEVARYVHILTTPWELIDLVTAGCSVIVIDGCRGAARPGSVVVCDESELSLIRTGGCSTHGANLRDVVELARRLNRPIRELVVFAVEVEACEPETEMSESARAGIEVAVQMVRKKLAEWKANGMHEYSLAQALLRQIVQIQERERASRVTAIHVSVGEFAGVDSELLRIAFQDVASQTALAAARLVVETVTLQACCEGCRAEFPIERFRFVCPHCGDQNVTMVRGEELILERVELETEEP